MIIVHLEDNPTDAHLVERRLRARWPECFVLLCANEAQYRAALERCDCDAILSDFKLGSFSGGDALQLARRIVPHAPFLFLSGTIGEDRAMEMMHAGAADYVLKNNLKRLVPALERAIAEQRERAHRQEAELRVRELNLMLDQAHDAIVIVDLIGRIAYWSRGAERVFGWPRQLAVGRTAPDIFRPELLPALQAASESTLAHGEWKGEIALNHRQGEILTLEMRRTLVRDGDGAPKAHLSISTDITQKKRLEEHVQRVHRLENIGRITAAVAHDLNNILAPITLGIPLLRENPGGAETANLLGMLEQSAARATEMVRNMLSFVSPGAATQDLTSVPALFAEIGEIIERTFPPNIHLEKHCSSALPPVAMNATQMHQILMNLCVNARDAMPAGGRLELRADFRRIAVAEAKVKAGDYVALEVEDTGTGIAPQVLARMWEAFYSTKESGRGTGLGLSTVKGIVESHGGAIEVKTVVGQGSVFRLFLPVAPRSESRSPASMETPPPLGNGETLLLVDDEAALRLVIAAVLTEAGYRVVLAANGSQALDLHSQRGREIALVITDNVMPGIDGPKLARLLRGIDPALPIVAMTGAQGGAAAVFDPGTIQGSISKPCQARDLLEAVARVLRPRAGQGEAP